MNAEDIKRYLTELNDELIKKLELKNAAEIVAIVKNYYPRKEIKPEARIMIEELVQSC